MLQYSPPEIQRCPLEHLVLQVSRHLAFSATLAFVTTNHSKVNLLGMGSPETLLSEAMQPPDVSTIGETVISLKNCGTDFTPLRLKT